MSMPDNELASQPVVSEIKFPDKLPLWPRINAGLLFDRENGGIALNDPSEGLQYQAWNVSYTNDDVILTPEDVGAPSVSFTLPGITELSLAFDQNMNEFIAYVVGGVAWYYWYDPIALQYQHVQMAAGVSRPRCTIDDKRYQMVNTSDVILAYMLGGALYYRQERDRYTIERLLNAAPEGVFDQVSMGVNNRLHYSFWLEFATPPSTNLDNLDFELGDTNWTQAFGADFSIGQDDPQTGFYNATLNTVPANYSLFVNDSYFSVTGGQNVTIKVNAKSLGTTSYAFGFQAYDADFNYVGRYELSVDVGLVWAESVWIATVPTAAVHIRLVLSSNATDGIVYIDNLSVTT